MPCDQPRMQTATTLWSGNGLSVLQMQVVKRGLIDQDVLNIALP